MVCSISNTQYCATLTFITTTQISNTKMLMDKSPVSSHNHHEKLRKDSEIHHLLDSNGEELGVAVCNHLVGFHLSIMLEAFSFERLFSCLRRGSHVHPKIQSTFYHHQ